MTTNFAMPPDDATDHILGSASAAVDVIEYGDFECPSCVQAHSAIKIMLKHFGHDVRFVFRHFPQVEVHPHAELAAEAAEAAGAQGRFWPFHDALFERDGHLSGKHFREYAERLELDLERFDYELRDHLYLQRVQEQLAGGKKLGVRSTPAFYVNGAYTDVSFGLQHLHEGIERELRKSR